ncbi:DUF968 domain-containing protein [Kosakonia cowanii]
MAKQVMALNVDPETLESFMLRPKRRRWKNERYTRWLVLLFRFIDRTLSIGVLA